METKIHVSNFTNHLNSAKMKSVKENLRDLIYKEEVHVKN